MVRLTDYSGSILSGTDLQKGFPNPGTPEFSQSSQTAPSPMSCEPVFHPEWLFTGSKLTRIFPAPRFCLLSFLSQIPSSPWCSPIPLLFMWLHFSDFLYPPYLSTPNKQSRSDPQISPMMVGMRQRTAAIWGNHYVKLHVLWNVPCEEICMWSYLFRDNLHF